MFRAGTAQPAGSSVTARTRRRRVSFANLPVAFKILAAVLLVGAIGAATNVIAVAQIGRLGGDANEIYTRGLKPLPLITEFRRGFITSRLDILNIVTSMTEDERNSYHDLVVKDIAAADAALAAYAPNASDPAAFAELKKQWDAYEQVRDDQLLPAAMAGDLKTVDKLRDTVTGPMQDRIKALVQTLEDKQMAQADRTRATAAAAASSARRLVLALLVLGLAAGTGLALLVSRLIVRPLRRVRTVLEALASGDLTTRPEVTSTDEVGAMASSLSAALDSLGEMVSTLHDSATTLGASSGQLSAASTQIAGSAEETSAQSTVVAAAAEQVSRSIQTVATGTEEMGASIREISGNATEAASVAASAVEKSSTARRTVQELGVASSEVGAVVKVITTIAEQTNLLALNATIEAARAGAAGKGFAVVASEVKDLAQETAKATGDIARRIDAIQASTTAATDAIGDISTVIGQIYDFQTTIASAVEEQTATTAEMSRNVTEAAAAAADIASNITSVAEAARATTGGATETERAAGDLARMGTELMDRVSRFRW